MRSTSLFSSRPIIVVARILSNRCHLQAMLDMERWQLRIYIYISWSMYIYTAYIEIVYHIKLYNMYIYILYLLCYIETYLMSQTPLEANFWQKPSCVLRCALKTCFSCPRWRIPNIDLHLGGPRLPMSSCTSWHLNTWNVWSQIDVNSWCKGDVDGSTIATINMTY